MMTLIELHAGGGGGLLTPALADIGPGAGYALHWPLLPFTIAAGVAVLAGLFVAARALIRRLRGPAACGRSASVRGGARSAQIEATDRR